MSLENKVDSKQWIPVWGVYQVLKDSYNGKPTIVTDGAPFDLGSSFIVSAFYHAATIMAITYGLGTLVDKL